MTYLKGGGGVKLKYPKEGWRSVISAGFEVTKLRNCYHKSEICIKHPKCAPKTRNLHKIGTKTLTFAPKIWNWHLKSEIGTKAFRNGLRISGNTLNLEQGFAQNLNNYSTDIVTNLLSPSRRQVFSHVRLMNISTAM